MNLGHTGIVMSKLYNLAGFAAGAYSVRDGGRSFTAATTAAALIQRDQIIRQQSLGNEIAITGLQGQLEQLNATERLADRVVENTLQLRYISLLAEQQIETLDRMGSSLSDIYDSLHGVSRQHDITNDLLSSPKQTASYENFTKGVKVTRMVQDADPADIDDLIERSSAYFTMALEDDEFNEEALLFRGIWSQLHSKCDLEWVDDYIVARRVVLSELRGENAHQIEIAKRTASALSCAAARDLVRKGKIDIYIKSFSEFCLFYAIPTERPIIALHDLAAHILSGATLGFLQPLFKELCDAVGIVSVLNGLESISGISNHPSYQTLQSLCDRLLADHAMYMGAALEELSND